MRSSARSSRNWVTGVLRRGTFLALALAALATPGRANANHYTLEQLIARVSVDYPGVIAARESLASSEAQLSQANRLWWPTGNITFGITGSPEVRCADVNGNINPNQNVREANCIQTNAVDFRSHIDEILPVHGVAFNLQVNLLQPLYTSGKIEATKAAARAGLDAAKGSVEAARADATINAVRAYWGVKWSRAAQGTLEDGIDRLKTKVAEIEKAINNGSKDYQESDLARLRLALDNAMISLADVKRGRAIAEAGLRVIANDPEADVDEEELDVVEHSDQPLSYYEDAAQGHRPEARMISAGIEAARSWRRLKLSELFPDFGLAFNFTYALASAIDNPFNAFMLHPNALGVGLLLVAQQPLDLPMRLARLSQARADERAAEARRKQAQGGIQWDIATAYANLQEARERLAITGHAEKTARGWYRRNDDALTPELRELAESARVYFENRLRHLQAIMDVNIAVAALRRATGVD